MTGQDRPAEFGELTDDDVALLPEASPAPVPEDATTEDEASAGKPPGERSADA